jgi:hypothetical protein
MSVYQMVALGSAALAVAAAAWDAWRLRREQRFSLPVMVITAGGPVLSLLLYLLITNLALKQFVTIGAVLLGLAIGVWAGRLAKLSTVAPGGQVRLVGASWQPLPAALAVGAIQIAFAIESFAAQVISLAVLEAAVSFGVSSAVALAVRRATMPRSPGPATGIPGGPGWGVRPGG